MTTNKSWAAFDYGGELQLERRKAANMVETCDWNKGTGMLEGTERWTAFGWALVSDSSLV